MEHAGLSMEAVNIAEKRIQVAQISCERLGLNRHDSFHVEFVLEQITAVQAAINGLTNQGDEEEELILDEGKAN